MTNHEHDAQTFDALATGAVTTPGGHAAGANALRRFEPGAIVAGRYRLVALLGRGGMGEVYRADDLTLDQPVALKFLPQAVGRDPLSLSRFHNELRVARQVSHRNVCRLYDVGEADGHRFLTMEYIDGEDLGTLLRRIGRLPQDKAVQIARQLCAGVAAAHERGVLHRDLKPANVMIDGQGDARITDFGIATAASDTAHETAGTPQYMAPELFAGQPASIKSDVYALGLTLYELFTGKRAYDSGTLPELQKLHEAGTVTTPSALVRDLDPRVEIAIMRCLRKDIDQRPASALAVAAALPGADALADALAAGETPSPELIAAAGQAEAQPVRWGLALLTFVVVGVLITASLAARTSFFGVLPHELPPAVLADRAATILRGLGFTDQPGAVAYEFQLEEDVLSWIRSNRRTPDRWQTLPTAYPSALAFWYRTSPGLLTPLEQSRVTRNDPAMVQTGSRLVLLDSTGRLLAFRSVPSPVEGAEPVSAEPRWNVLFEAAALNQSAFTPVAAQWVPPDFADTRLAWEGPAPAGTGRVRVEASSHRGVPASFMVVGGWSRPWLPFPRGMSAIDRWITGIAVGVVMLLLGIAVVMARRNVGESRADWRGALRVARTVGLASFVGWALMADHQMSVEGELENAFRSSGLILVRVGMLWTFYMALEPSIRRFWPQSLLGWSRLLEGRIRDARVGRDLLIGAAFGVVLIAVDVTRLVSEPLLGYVPPPLLLGLRVELLDGPGGLVGHWIQWAVNALLVSLLAVLLIVVLRRVLRWNWLALSMASLLMAVEAARYMSSSSASWDAVFPFITSSLLIFITVRFGFVSVVVARFVWYVLYGVPITLDVSNWAAPTSLWTLALIAALTAFGFYASRAGQPLFGQPLKE